LKGKKSQRVPSAWDFLEFHQADLLGNVRFFFLNNVYISESAATFLFEHLPVRAESVHVVTTRRSSMANHAAADCVMRSPALYSISISIARNDVDNWLINGRAQNPFVAIAEDDIEQSEFRLARTVALNPKIWSFVYRFTDVVPCDAPRGYIQNRVYRPRCNLPAKVEQQMACASIGFRVFTLGGLIGDQGRPNFEVYYAESEAALRYVPKTVRILIIVRFLTD
jgi:hypothetical protein